LASKPSNDKYRAIKNTGKKLIKYLEVRKCDIPKNLNNKKTLIMGRTKTAIKRREIFRVLEKTGTTINMTTETTVRGKWGTQSCIIP
jgi:hypothetical protein